jgi:hypothetical protein
VVVPTAGEVVAEAVVEVVAGAVVEVVAEAIALVVGDTPVGDVAVLQAATRATNRSQPAKKRNALPSEGNQVTPMRLPRIVHGLHEATIRTGSESSTPGPCSPKTTSSNEAT